MASQAFAHMCTLTLLPPLVLLPVWPLMLDTYFNEKYNPYHCFHQASWVFYFLILDRDLRCDCDICTSSAVQEFIRNISERKLIYC